MPQEFCVLCCFSCMKYQVHPVKKSNKWICKVCGSKQSVKKIYCTSSSRDCRNIVQKLNTLRGEKLFQEEMLRKHKSLTCNDEQTDDDGCCNYKCEKFSSEDQSPEYFSENNNFLINYHCNANSIQERKEKSFSVKNPSKFQEICDTSDEKHKSLKRQKIIHESTCSNLERVKPVLKELTEQNYSDRYDLDDVDLSFDELAHKRRYSPLAQKQNNGFQFIVNAAKKSV